MSIGRILTLGLGVFGGPQYLPTLGYAAATPYVTERLSLIGASRERIACSGASAQRFDARGAIERRITLEGTGD